MPKSLQQGPLCKVLGLSFVLGHLWLGMVPKRYGARQASLVS